MNNEENAVLNLLKTATGKLTQRQIALSEPFMGCNIHELDSVPKSRQFETTLRRVRQIIRDLRINHKQPILSDAHGYWYSTDIDEVNEVLQRMESMAYAQAAAWYETYRAMVDIYHVKSNYFDRQLDLFCDTTST